MVDASQPHEALFLSFGSPWRLAAFAGALRVRAMVITAQNISEAPTSVKAVGTWRNDAGCKPLPDKK